VTEGFFIKMHNALHPAHAEDQELLSNIKAGQPVRLKLTRVRNYEFFKKWWALIDYAFDMWEPPEAGEGSAWREAINVEKNKDRFRKDITILAGFYEATYRLNGDVRIEAKSISFGSMSEDEFEELYTKTIDVVVKQVLRNYDGETLRGILEQVEGFE